MPSGWVKVGKVAVDSGQVVLMDPCYLRREHFPENHDEGPDLDREPQTLYEGCCKTTLGEPGAGAVSFGAGQHEGFAVASGTGWGDGLYQVRAKIVNGRVMALRIDFD